MPWRNPATATEGLMWGRVRNASNGSYVDDATVTVNGSGRPAVKTDGNGYYIATLIPATAGGTSYSVTASKTGMTSQTVSNATVLAGDIVRYDLFLNPPGTPSGLTATAVSGSQINLLWTDNATNETGFIVARTTVSGGPYTNLASLAANATSYANTGLPTNTTYYYVVRATNSYTASANSAQAGATTLTPPAITNQPVSLVVTAGQNATFSVAAAGSPPLSYQWRFNTTNLAGATASSFTRTNVQPTDAGDYSVVVTNAAGSITSSNALLTVLQAPPAQLAIGRQPDGQMLLQVTAAPGLYRVEAAPELTNAVWEELTNLTNPGSGFEYTDPQTNLPQRFYRTRRLQP
jgi:hypothetical protein